MKKIAFILVLIFWAVAGSLSLNGQVNFSVTSKPDTYTGDASGLRDCVDEHPCYTVYVYMVYKDNTGVCCSGYTSENVTGQDLFDGVTLQSNIILN
jgi:hypothetical protein